MKGKILVCNCLALLTPLLLLFSQSQQSNDSQIIETSNIEEPMFMTSPSLDYFQKNEPQLFSFWNDLTAEQQNALASQLEQVNIASIEKERQLIQDPGILPNATFEAFDDFAFSGNLEDKIRGQKLVELGRLGCLLLAGGQGTRLKVQGPKGLYPISVIKNKTLFQLCAEKVVAASKLANRPLQLAIMTSPENDEQTRAFFKENDYFGLLPDQVDFYIQATLPFLDANGKLFLETPWKLCTGPDGNGHWLLSFMQSGVWEKWTKQGIDYIHVVLVDNPIADPFDPELLGFHERQQVEITLKCTEKNRPDEKVGVLVKQDGHWGVVEYSEFPDEEKKAQRADGGLKHCCGNLSLFCFSMSFVERMVNEGNTLPLHKAWKAARYVNDEKKTQLSSEPIAWKFETFIFDWLTYTDKVAALLYPREECFAPLKNLTGLDSPNTVREALLKKDRKVIQELTGIEPPDFPIELAAEFHYPTPELRNKWEGKPVTTPYVKP